MSDTAIAGVAMISVYASDFDASFQFYHVLLALEHWHPMGDSACYFTLPDERGMYLVGRCTPAHADIRSAHTTFAFEVASAQAMYRKLKAAGVELLQEEPVDMGQGYFWFQLYDPSGNVVEILGGY